MGEEGNKEQEMHTQNISACEGQGQKLSRYSWCY